MFLPVRHPRYIHDRRELHRDIKPGNILLNMSAQAELSCDAKLADFGLCQHLDQEEVCSSYVGAFSFPLRGYCVGVHLHHTPTLAWDP